ncbi:MAG TPA: 2-C-methyl-D-erythritol 2,4-cyclodiphosphate synthase [Candidatus Eremiobacteraceae bacterium]|nr:2-C-methyl-D-erythritol 2,4-cyclodiphosphate synthase [Candidatus Eremiobacteraceae bacterium]
MRAGFGYDAHRLAPGRPLVLGGVAIPFDRGLIGHSDADAATHAVIDAVLGAAAAGDCGSHFPASDPRFAGARSTDLLADAARVVRAAGFSIVNVDCTIVAQAPPLASHVPAMRAALAAAAGIALDQVSVKAKSPEGLGFAGTGEGIEAFATAMLEATT